MMRKLVFALALLTVCSAAFAQVSDPADGLKQLNEYSAQLRKEAADAGTQLNITDFANKLQAKAAEMVKGLDVEKIDADKGYVWSQLLRRAGQSKEACRAVTRYIETNPADKVSAQMYMASICYEQKEADMVKKTLLSVQPGQGTEAYMFGTGAVNYSDLIEQVSGPALTVGFLDDIEKKIQFGDPIKLTDAEVQRYKDKGQAFPNGQDEETFRKATQKRMESMERGLKYAFVERRAELYAASGRKDQASSTLKDYIAKAAEGDTNIRMAKANLARMTMTGAKAPSLNVERTIGDFPGLDAWKGKVVIVDFFAHWCGPCIASFPDMKQLLADYKDKGLEVVGYTTYYGYYKRENVEKRDMAKDVEFGHMKEFITEKDMTWPVAYGDRSVFEAYGVTGIPQVVLIDRQGNVNTIHIGYSKNSFAEFRKKVEELLKQN